MVKFDADEYMKWLENQKQLEKKQIKEGYFWDTKDPGFGMEDINSKDWLKMKGGFKNEYWKLKGQALYDPALMKMEETANKDYVGLGRSVALGQADQATNAVSQALAARGGGNIASALTMGAQGRVGAGLQGLQSGLGMQMGALGQYLQTKWGTLTALFGGQAGVYSTQIQSEAMQNAATTQAIGSAVGGLAGGLAGKKWGD